MVLPSSTEIGIVAAHVAPLNRHAKHDLVPWFEILVHTPDSHWCVHRVYDDFEHLHAQICARFTTDDYALQLPTPSLFHLSFSKQTRLNHKALRLQYELNEYLHRLLEIQHIYESGMVQAFLDERPHSPLASCTYSPPSSCSTWDESALPSDSSVKSSTHPSSLHPPAFAFPKLTPPTRGAAPPVLFGQPMQWSGCGGLRLGFAKPHPLSPACVTMTRDNATAVTLVAETVSHLTRASRPIRFTDSCLFRSATGKYLKVTRNGHVRQTHRRSKASLFRVMSPFGVDGDVHYEDDVAFQVDGHHCGHPGRWLWLTAFKNGSLLASAHVAPVVFGLHGMATARVAPLSSTNPLAVRGLVYNVWCLPRVATSLLHLSPWKRERTAAIPSALPSDVDFVVFCEAFDEYAKQTLTTEMKRHGFLYETATAGGLTKLKLFNSGVFVMSKYPLVAFDQLLYGAAAIADEKMVDKAALYVQMIKDNQVVHVFATHTQAWDHKAAVACRAKQIRMLAAWMQSKDIPESDPVIVAGDFNIDQFVDPCTEFDWMTATLAVESPPTVQDTPKYSFDPITNALASTGMSSGGKLERLDYVMTSTRHRQPTASATQVLPLKAAQGWFSDQGAWVTDLSDHYPVVSEFHFD